MSPSVVLKRIFHGDTVNATLFGKGRYGYSAPSKTLPCFSNLLFGEFGIVSLCSNGLSSLGYLVRYVVGICAQKQVAGIATRRIIAFVADVQAFRDWAIRQYPCDTVGGSGLLVKSGVPVALVISATLPFPTIVWAENFYLCPKMFRDGGRATETCMVSMNEAKRFALYLAALVCVSCRNLRLLSATAMAITVGNIIRGIMGLHKNLHFLCHVPGCYQHRWDNFIGCYSFIIPQGGTL